MPGRCWIPILGVFLALSGSGLGEPPERLTRPLRCRSRPRQWTWRPTIARRAMPSVALIPVPGTAKVALRFPSIGWAIGSKRIGQSNLDACLGFVPLSMVLAPPTSTIGQ